MLANKNTDPHHAQNKDPDRRPVVCLSVATHGCRRSAAERQRWLHISTTAIGKETPAAPSQEKEAVYPTVATQRRLLVQIHVTGRRHATVRLKGQQATLLLCIVDCPSHQLREEQENDAARHLHVHHDQLPLLPNDFQWMAGEITGFALMQ